MMGIIDYGLGNIYAISNIYNKLKVENMIIKSVEDFDRADKFILPGVGAFDSAINLLDKSKLVTEIKEQVFKKKKKILGICVGMQIFAESSSEGRKPGFKWLSAKVKKINFDKNIRLRLPHMGWNSIKIVNEDNIFNNLNNNEYFYFCHSYYFDCHIKENILAETNYGLNFSSVVKKDNIYGIQFHPEKSHDAGETILNNFSKL